MITKWGEIRNKGDWLAEFRSRVLGLVDQALGLHRAAGLDRDAGMTALTEDLVNVYEALMSAIAGKATRRELGRPNSQDLAEPDDAAQG